MTSIFRGGHEPLSASILSELVEGQVAKRCRGRARSARGRPAGREVEAGDLLVARTKRRVVSAVLPAAQLCLDALLAPLLAVKDPLGRAFLFLHSGGKELVPLPLPRCPELVVVIRLMGLHPCF